MSNGLKIIILSVGIFITCIVVSIGIYITRNSNNSIKEGIHSVGLLTEEYDETALHIYHDVKVSGKEVINLIQRSKDKDIPIFISVKTKENRAINGTFYLHERNADGTLGNTLGIYNEEIASAESKINEHATFLGKIERNKSKVIIGIYFSQQ